jgi:hypothetical protein
MIEVLSQAQDDAETETATLRRENERLTGELAEIKGQVAALLELAKRAPPAPPRIAAWRVDESNACATPQMSDGSLGAPLQFLNLFVALAARFAEAEKPSKRARAPRANGVEATP